MNNKKHVNLLRGVCLCSALGLTLVMAGCASKDGATPNGSSSAPANDNIMNNPHVPDSVKQHIQSQQLANQQASQGYTAELERKSRGAK